MKKILLTGGYGMVGMNIREHQKARAWNIIAPSSQELDLMDYEATYSYIKNCQPDLIVHAAGLVGGIRANINNPVSFLDTNLMVGRNLILAAYRNGIENLLNLGSACMYPRAVPNPLLETSILSGELEPTNEGYALAKIVVARLCQYISNTDPSFRYKTLIPCNIFGRFDKFLPEKSHLIPAIIVKIDNAMKKGETTVEVWGDGTARREFMYAGDLADAVLTAANNLDFVPSTVNCALGYDYSINQYYQEVARVLGWHGTFTHDLSKPVGMKQKLCDITLQQKWGWRAKTTLTEGIKMTYEYYGERN